MDEVNDFDPGSGDDERDLISIGMTRVRSKVLRALDNNKPAQYKRTQDGPNTVRLIGFDIPLFID